MDCASVERGRWQRNRFIVQLFRGLGKYVIQTKKPPPEDSDGGFISNSFLWRSVHWDPANGVCNDVADGSFIGNRNATFCVEIELSYGHKCAIDSWIFLLVDG
jgi:hypothetical protein